MKQIIATLLALLCLIIPASAFASVGVGVGTGRISVNEPLKSGGIYNLPKVIVFNTGSQQATYSMSVTLNQTQPQLKPNPEWISFSPQTFSLAPGQSAVVTPTVHLPLVTKPGKYFGYLEAHPDKTVKQGTTAVGVAAATKLSFTVIPYNFFLAILFHLIALYRLYEPWTQLATAAIIAGAVLLLINRHIKLGAAIKAAWSAGRAHKD